MSVIYKYKNWLFDLIKRMNIENIGFINSNDNVWLDNPLPESIRKSSTLIFKIQNLNFSLDK